MTEEGQAMKADTEGIDPKSVGTGQNAAPLMKTYPRAEADAKRLANDFVFHEVKGDQAQRYQQIRTMQRLLAEIVLDRCPPSRERSLAITKLEEVGFWANASIARNE